MSDAEFKVGDKVSFTTMAAGRGGSIRLSSKIGVIDRIGATTADVIYRKRSYFVALSEIRHAGQRNALTEAFMAMGDNSTGEGTAS